LSTDDHLIENLRKQPEQAKPVPVDERKTTSPYIAARGNQVDQMVKEIWQVVANGSVNLLPDEYHELNSLRLKGVETLTQARWVRKIYAQYGIFYLFWRR